jgi:hypothetical protein
VRFLTLFRGVRDRSGAQLTFGDFALCPCGSITRRNSVAVWGNDKRFFSVKFFSEFLKVSHLFS